MIIHNKPKNKIKKKKEREKKNTNPLQETFVCTKLMTRTI